MAFRQVCFTLALSLPDELRDGLVVKPVSLPYRRQSRALWLGSGMARAGRVSYNGTRPIIGNRRDRFEMGINPHGYQVE